MFTLNIPKTECALADCDHFVTSVLGHLQTHLPQIQHAYLIIYRLEFAPKLYVNLDNE